MPRGSTRVDEKTSVRLMLRYDIGPLPVSLISSLSLSVYNSEVVSGLP
jgi:hypothetical protein